MSPTGLPANPAGSAPPLLSVVRRREDVLTGWLAIIGGVLIVVGVSTTLVIYSIALAGWTQRPVSALLLAPASVCFWAGHGVLAVLTFWIGIRAFRGRPGDGTGLFLLGIMEVPSWILFFGGPLALAGGVVLLVAGIHARVHANSSPGYSPRGGFE